MEKPWLKHYHKAVPAEINPDEFASISAMFEAMVDKYQSRIALKNLGHTLSYTELQEKVHAFAAYLQQDLNLQKGDRIAIMLPNCMQYVISMLAAFKAGLTIVNVNPLYTARELTHQLNDSQPKAIIVLANVANVLAEALPKLNLRHIIITQLGDAFPMPKAFAINFALKYIKKMLPRYHIKSYIKFRVAVRHGRKRKFKAVDVSGDDIAFLQYTGGTTGIAKGAVLTHRNMIANVEQACAWIMPILSDEQPIGVTPLPLYHIFSLMASCLVYLKLGVMNILVTNPRDIPAMVALFKEHKVNALMGVNTLFNALISNEEFKHVDHSGMSLVIAGGMALQEAVANRWHEITGKRIIEGYGLTESAPIDMIGALDGQAFTGSIGYPIPSTLAKIADDDGNEVALGEVGELCVKGPQVMQGYWNMPEETSQVLSDDGWLKTGDMARMDETGLVYIVDRKKDMIDVAGFNVYPNEVEAVLAKHPKVAEVAVVGVPNRITGESVQAYIVAKDKSLTKTELSAYCRSNMTSYKVPRRFVFKDELPKSVVGKILRRELKSETK